MKNKIALLLTLAMVLVLLCGCFDEGNRDLSDSGSHKETTSAEAETETETAPVDLFPTVPDELEGSYFLSSVGLGRCSYFVGKIRIQAVLVNDGDSVWDEASVTAWQENFDNVIETFRSAAAEYSVDLQLDGGAVEVSVDGPVSWEDAAQVGDDVMKLAGWESLDLASELICGEFDADQCVIVLCFNKGGRSFSIIGEDEDDVEYTVVYEHDVETYMHEIFHLFGTLDYYYPADIKEISEKYFSGTIMASGTEPVVDSLSAFVIGWTDELSEDALAFLEDTAYYSYSDAESAESEESFTGKVTDREVEGYVDGVVQGIGLYTGDFVGGVADGYGELKYYSGDSYKGGFSFGNYYGEGEYVYANGDVLRGNWVNNKLEGYGFDERVNGNRYEGEFKNGRYHGQGNYLDSDGNKYEGQWVDGKFHGYGVFYWTNGAVYEGEFQNGSLTGYGTYTSAFGEVYTGYFEDWTYMG